MRYYDASVWLGLLAPTGTPPEIVARLYNETARILKSPEVEASFNATGTQVTTSSPEQFAEFLRSELEKWAKVIKDVGAKVN